MQDIDKEKIRAFEQKMHDEGADGFADGPRPWETWDESGAQAGNSKRIWEGKARRIYKHTSVQRTLGDRIISALAMLALATMVVGIVGVYLTEEKPQPVAWTAIHPTPIPLAGQGGTADRQRLPERLARPAPVVAEIESLPAPAAGNTAAAGDSPAADLPANDTPLLSGGAESGPEVDATPGITPPAAGVPAAEPAWDAAASSEGIEVVTTPSAVLLTSSDSRAPEGGDASPGTGMDPELAMEIATAPAVDNILAAAPVAVSGMMPQTFRGSDSREARTPVAANRIIRDTTSPATADTAAPATGTAATAERDAITDTPAGVSESPPQDVVQADTPTALPDSNAPMAANDAALTESQEEVPAAAAPPATPAAAPAPVSSAKPDTAADEPDTAATEAPAGDEPPITTGKDAPPGEHTVATLATAEPVTAAAPAGGWVVNLASYKYEAMARKKLDEFQAKGVTAEIEHTRINDRPIYRVRVTGFDSSRSARASISSLEKTLGLKGVWISRR